jgi:hypothetical protein
LVTSGYQSVDVIANWNENLASQVTAFLSTVELVFEMDGSSAIFSKQFCELHD